MLDFETVSQGNRHRSNHTQNEVPSIVAVHQSLQSGCKVRILECFPSRCDTSRLLLEQTHFSASLSSPDCLFRICCLASGAFMMLVLHLPEDMFLEKNWVSHFCFSARAVDLAVIPGKSDILEVTGFITVSDKKMLIRFSSEITEEHFTVHPSSVRAIPTTEKYST